MLQTRFQKTARALRALMALTTAATFVVLVSPDLHAGTRKVGKYEPLMLPNGLMLPYPMDNLFRGWARCRGGEHTHRALDIAGVGKHWGVGTPVRAIAKMRITAVGTPEKSEKKYGRRLKSNGTVKRGSSKLPCSATIAGYGKVYFFTSNYGRYRSGVIVTGKVLEGTLKGHKVRYLHLAAHHPAVKQGGIVHAGQEIGLMGGTAVQEDPPHLHFEILSPKGEKLDPGPFLGIGSTIPSCRGGSKEAWDVRKKYSARARKLMAKLRREAAKRPRFQPGGRVTARKAKAGKGRHTRCGVETVKLSFKNRWTTGRRWILKGLDRKPGRKERWILRIISDGAFEPRIELRTSSRSIFSGNWANRKDKRDYGLRVLKSGKNGTVAELAFKPGRKDLVVMARSWQKKSQRRKDRKFWLPKNKLGFTIEIERPCR